MDIALAHIVIKPLEKPCLLILTIALKSWMVNGEWYIQVKVNLK